MALFQSETLKFSKSESPTKDYQTHQDTRRQIKEPYVRGMCGVLKSRQCSPLSSLGLFYLSAA